MKKVCRKIKLRKFKTEMLEIGVDISNHDGESFMVIFANNKALKVYDKEDLERVIARDHINPIMYIFDMNDKIILERDVIIDTDNI